MTSELFVILTFSATNEPLNFAFEFISAHPEGAKNNTFSVLEDMVMAGVSQNADDGPGMGVGVGVVDGFTG